MRLVFLGFILLSVFSLSAQDTSSVKYKVCLHFNSICCGVPNDSLLKVEIKKFRNKYHLKRKIKALHVSPLGREGEYALYFTLKEIPSKQRSAFIKMIDRAIPKMNDKGIVWMEKPALLDRKSLPTNANYTFVFF